MFSKCICHRHCLSHSFCLLVRSCFLITLVKCLKGQSLKDRSLKALNVFVICHCLCICICRCPFVGQVMFSHHSDEMSQRSKVSEIALWRCSLNLFVIFIVFVFVFVFVVVFLLVRSCFLMTPIRSARSGRLWIQHSQYARTVSDKWVSDQGRPRAARAAKKTQKIKVVC